jgi:uncharacterized protein YjcR
MLRMSTKDRETIAKLYGQGYKAKALAERFGISEKQARDIANKSGVIKQHRIEPEKRTAILADYIAGLPAVEVAEKHGVHHSIIPRIATAAGYTIKTKIDFVREESE